MLKRLFLSILFVAVTTAAFAGYVMNPYTGKMDNIGPMKYNGTSAEVDGSLYVDHSIYVGGVLLTSGGSANPTANAVSKSTGSALVDSGIYAVGSNVGIGTTAPVASLDVNSTIYSHGNVAIGTSLLTGGRLVVMGGNIGLGTTAPVSLLDVNRLVNVLSGGNVGINTTVPAAKLQVDGAIYANDGTSTPTNSAVSLASAGDAMIGGDMEVDGMLYADGGLAVAGTGAGQFGTTAPTWAGVSLASSGDLMVSGDVEIDGKLYLDGGAYVAGNVGIGTSIPIALLDVDGSVYLHRNVGIGTSNATAALDVIGQLAVGDLTADRYTVDYNLTNSNVTTERTVASVGKRDEVTHASLPTFTWWTGSGGAATQRMVLTNAGNLGIGTSTASQKLEVDGGVYSKTTLPYVRATVTTTANLTKADMTNYSYIPVSTSGGAYTMTLYSDSAGSDLVDIGRHTWICITAGGTNALTIAGDSDLTVTTITAMTAGGLLIEDVGDCADVIVSASDNLTVITYEAD
jgi:hypothetical protein